MIRSYPRLMINIILGSIVPLIVIALIRLYLVDQSTQNQGASALSEAMALNVAHRRGFRWPILLANIRFLRIKVRISVGQWIGSSLKMIL